MTAVLIGLAIAAAAALCVLLLGMCKAAGRKMPQPPTPAQAKTRAELNAATLAHIAAENERGAQRLLAAIRELEVTEQETTPIHDELAVEHMVAELNDEQTMRKYFG